MLLPILIFDAGTIFIFLVKVKSAFYLTTSATVISLTRGICLHFLGLKMANSTLILVCLWNLNQLRGKKCQFTNINVMPAAKILKRWSWAVSLPSAQNAKVMIWPEKCQDAGLYQNQKALAAKYRPLPPQAILAVPAVHPPIAAPAVPR